MNILDRLVDEAKKKKRQVHEGVRDVFDANTAGDQQRRAAAGQPRLYAEQQSQHRQSNGAPSYGTNPVKSTASRVMDMFNANSAQDQFKRINQGQARNYAEQQRDRGIGRISDNPLQRTGNTLKAAGEAITEAPKRLTTGIAETLAYNTAAQKGARAAQESYQKSAADVQLRASKSSNPKLKDFAAAQALDAFKVANDRNKQLQDRVDPKKGAASVAQVGFDTLTLGVGAGGVQAAKAAGKAATQQVGKNTAKTIATKPAITTAEKKAIVETSKQSAKTASRKAVGKELIVQGAKIAPYGATSGAISPFVFKGEDTTLKDVGIAAAGGAVLSSLMPGAGFAVSRGASKIKTDGLPIVKEAADKQAATMKQVFNENPVPYHKVSDEDLISVSKVRNAQTGGHQAVEPTDFDYQVTDKVMRQLDTKRPDDLDDVVLARNSYQQNKMIENPITGEMIPEPGMGGGYARIPGGAKDPAPDLNPNQKEVINTYANTIEDMGTGNGVAITPDGRRISNNVRDAETAGQTMNKRDWFDKARADIESGKAGFGASDEYKRISAALDEQGFPGTPAKAEPTVAAQSNVGRLDDAMAENDRLIDEVTPAAPPRNDVTPDEVFEELAELRGHMKQHGTDGNYSQDNYMVQSRIDELEAQFPGARQAEAPPANVVPDEVARMQEAEQRSFAVDNNGVAQEVPKVDGPEPSPSGFANKTVQNSDEISPELKKMVKDEQVHYDTTSNESRILEADARLEGKSHEENFMQVLEGLKKGADDPSGQNKVTAITFAKDLDAKGDEASLFRATEIYHELSQRLSEAGQEIQAASLLASRTPQGVYYKAQKDLQAALGKEKFTPEIQKELKSHIDKLKSAEKNLSQAQRKAENATGTPKGPDARAAVKEAEDAAAIARDNVQYFVAQKIPTELGDKILNLWRSGLLTAPTTTGGAGVGNFTNTLIRKLWVNPNAAIVDWTISLGTKQRAHTLAKAGEWGKGAATGAKNAQSKQFWKTGYDPNNPMASSQSMGTHSRTINYGDGRIGKAVGGYVNGVYKLMGAADQPFRYAANTEILSSMAKAEAKNLKLKGAAKKQFIDDFINNPSDDVKFAALKEAAGSTFQNETILAKGAQSLIGGLRRSGHPNWAAFVNSFMPFTGIPSAVADRAIRHTGIKAAKEVTLALVRRSKGEKLTIPQQREIAQYMAEGTIGLPIVAAGFALAQADMYNGAFPLDPKERELWKAEGRQENSVKVGDRWYSLNYIQPFGMLLGVGAGIAQTKGEEGQQAKIEDYATNGAMSAMKSFMGQSYLQGLQGPLDAFNDPEKGGAKYVGSVASSIVPNAVRSLASATDDVQRETKGVVNGVKGAIPGLRQDLPEKQDMFGQTVQRKDTPANMYLNPLKPSKVRNNDDVAIGELRRLYNGDEGLMPTKAKKDAFDGTKLTPEQMREIDKAAGPEMKKAYEDTMNNPKYADLNDEEKRKALMDASGTVFGALKAKYGVENELVSADDVKLDTKQKRYLKGSGVDSLTKDNDRTFAEELEAKEDEWKKESGEWSVVKQANKRREIDQLKIKKDFDEDTVALYGMSKEQIYDIASNEKSGKSMIDKILAYDDAQVKAGLRDKHKFRDKDGNVAVRPKEKTGGKGRKGKAVKLNPSMFKTPYDILLKSSTKGSALARSAKLASKKA